MSLNFDEDILQDKIKPTKLSRVLVGMIDAVLTILFVTLLFVYQKPYFIYRVLLPINSTLLVFICFCIYRFIFLILFNGTIGMKLFKVVLLNGDEEPLSIKGKFFFSIFILYKGMDYYQAPFIGTSAY